MIIRTCAFTIFLITMACASRGQDTLMVIDFDVLTNNIAGISYLIGTKEFSYSCSSDSFDHSSVTTSDVEGNILKVDMYYRGALTNSISARRGNDSSMIYLVKSHGSNCSRLYIKSVCSHNNRKQLVEQRDFYTTKHLLFFKKKHIVYWHKFYYVAITDSLFAKAIFNSH